MFPMERIACGADSEVNYPSNHHFSRFSFSLWRMEGGVAFQGVGWGDETVALGKVLSWTGREPGGAVRWHTLQRAARAQL